MEIVACCDAHPERAERAAAAVAGWSPGAKPYTDLDRMLASEQIDAVLNLTPAPAHGPVTRAALDAGLHVYSEKPIASTMAEADALIELARERGRHLICAPAVAVTPALPLAGARSWRRTDSAASRWPSLTMPTLDLPRGASTPATRRCSTGAGSARSSTMASTASTG